MGCKLFNVKSTSKLPWFTNKKTIFFVLFYTNSVQLPGLELEGIYRISGQHSKVTRLLELFAAGLIY